MVMLTGNTVHVADNRIALLADGPEAKAALLAMLGEAQTSIRMFFYIFADDDSGTEVRDALTAAVARGVSVDLAVDGFGSGGTPAGFFEPLVAAGARFCRFLPRLGRRFLLRNHQKIVVVDDDAAILGGFNIADSYFEPGHPDAWRDLGVRIDGPAVTHLATYFDRLFAWMRSKRSYVWQLKRMLRQLSQRDGPVRWIFGGPSGRTNPYARQVQEDFARGSRLAMIMAYFAPTRRYLRLIGDIARRGEARLITAGKTDVALARMATHATYTSLLKRGVAIAEYRPRALHTKLIVIDDAVYIGSGNFDIRSLYLNLEVMLRIEDTGFAGDLHALFANEWSRSTPIDATHWAAQATWWRRAGWRFAYWVFATADFAMSRTLTSKN